MIPKSPFAYGLIACIIMICPTQGRAREPDCNCDAVIEHQLLAGPVRGMADTHTHQFSNMAFGGALLWGKPFDERNRRISAALSGCDYTWDYALWRADRRTQV